MKNINTKRLVLLGIAVLSAGLLPLSLGTQNGRVYAVTQSGESYNFAEAREGISELLQRYNTYESFDIARNRCNARK